MAQQPRSIKINPQPMSRDQITQQLINAKRRISQRKGEMADGLSDAITQEFASINQVMMQLFQEIDVKATEVNELKKQVEDLKKGKKLPDLESEKKTK